MFDLIVLSKTEIFQKKLMNMMIQKTHLYT
jgi:hypothetical protein